MNCFCQLSNCHHQFSTRTFQLGQEFLKSSGKKVANFHDYEKIGYLNCKLNSLSCSFVYFFFFIWQCILNKAYSCSTNLQWKLNREQEAQQMQNKFRDLCPCLLVVTPQRWAEWLHRALLIPVYTHWAETEGSKSCTVMHLFFKIINYVVYL